MKYERPYLQVTVFGKTFLGLLDSGASRTIIGKPGWDILRTLGIPLKRRTSSCTVASGQRCRIEGEISVPVQLRDRETMIGRDC